MRVRRVVITGMGAISPFGRGAEALVAALYAGRSGVVTFPDLGQVGGMRCRVAALVPQIDPLEIPRKFRRSMSALSIYATLAASDALTQAGLGEAARASGDMGVVLGSTIGSPGTIQEFFEDYLTDRSLERMRSTLFFQIMNHSGAANVAQALGITGRILAPSAACSTGCQAVGYGYEMIALGKQETMLCGGADEFHPLTAATFDVMNAVSTGYNDRPSATPRPFDRDRDGVVCAEGCGILLLESLDSALRRGAMILAEIVGFACVTDTSNIANPNAESMERCMRLALHDAGVAAADVAYVNAHATATAQGDVAEAEAIHAVFGGDVPVSSLKGHIGHTMAASGAIELIGTIAMMERGELIATHNLDHVDPACAMIRHARPRERREIGAAVKNNFALGGVNASLVLRRYRA
ncbi:MAG: 3-oxoacyl-ACP synthase [Desulfuromonadales bacterium GWD2_61_12]|nr:MAG: 3-oxoacyl-ACP synthase [Desulfuromonadales bacterium GWC2_61_20]OGR35683.1 MAG: 3-oxoacyl-ACP synthase [Desulfuromonadales bacterium GWD2_61_12]HAD04631.1 beta-ketoacyl-[acyl-carrier-protein] synthase family protein [Desulfuromonas sp.]HBT82668.1 beta-ketoacyl-[acyl-carrier-protein] synthase family protein [Desulfuromonas sp.]